MIVCSYCLRCEICCPVGIQLLYSLNAIRCDNPEHVENVARSEPGKTDSEASAFTS